MKHPVTLYQATTSSASWRIRIALALKRIDYVPRWLDLVTHENLSTDFRQVSPTGQVPCLEIDGLRLFQSVAIIEYLAETRGTASLLPTGVAPRARVRALVETVNSGIQPLHNFAVREQLTMRFNADAAAANDWCAYWIERQLHALESLISESGGAYCSGDELTAAAIFLYPQLRTSARFGVDEARFPCLYAIADRLAALPAFANSHPPG